MAWVDDGTAAGNGCYITGYASSDRNGTTIDTSTPLIAYCPRNGRREDPNIQANAIVPVAYDSTDTLVVVGDYLDGKVGESVKIFKGDPANVPPGWALCDAGKFFVGYDAADADYSTIGNVGGFKLHGGEEGGAANNHEDHNPIAVAGTGVVGPGGDGKGWQDGSWLHSETDNRPPYTVRAWIERVH